MAVMTLLPAGTGIGIGDWGASSGTFHAALQTNDGDSIVKLEYYKGKLLQFKTNVLYIIDLSFSYSNTVKLINHKIKLNDFS